MLQALGSDFSITATTLQPPKKDINK
jgi:hypothetical protein